MIVDLDHLLADPIYQADRCINFSPSTLVICYTRIFDNGIFTKAFKYYWNWAFVAYVN